MLVVILIGSVMVEVGVIVEVSAKIFLIDAVSSHYLVDIL